MDTRFDDVSQSPGRFSVRPCVRMRRGGSPNNALSEGCSLGRADPPQEDEGMGGQYRDGDAGGDRGTHAKQQEAARKEAAARKAPQDAAADAKGAGEPASKKGFGRPEQSSSRSGGPACRPGWRC